MKLALAATLATLIAAAGGARADEDTPQLKIAKAWMTAALAPDATVTAPSKDKPLDYVVLNGTKSCKALKTGVAKDAKAVGKLEKCLADTHKLIADGPTNADWEPGDNDIDGTAALFPKKYQKKIKAAGKGTTIVFAHYIGDGQNMDVYLGIGVDGSVKGVWVTEDFFE